MFRDYLKRIGDKAAAKKFGITERAARSYREGQRRPKPKDAIAMIIRSKGAFKLEDIYKA